MKRVFLPVAQENEYGCGVACIASIVGATYKEVASRLGRNDFDVRGLSAEQLSAGLKAFGKQYMNRFETARTNDDIEVGAIVKVRGKRYGKAGHYLVRTLTEWMDPWFNCPMGSGDTGPGRRVAKLRTRRPPNITSALLPISKLGPGARHEAASLRPRAHRSGPRRAG